MEHKVNLQEISDGRIYRRSDSVRIGCDGCQSLHSKEAGCCHFAEDTITLDPYDFYLLARNGLDFTALYQRQQIALSMVDGCILPHLNFSDNACPFLTKEGRCSIHSCRPGLCRLFPLARLFDEHGIGYIHQIHECPYSAGATVSIAEWLGLEDLTEYENFCIEWHELTAALRTEIRTLSDAERSVLLTKFLNVFFISPYAPKLPFEEQFEKRCQQLKVQKEM